MPPQDDNVLTPSQLNTLARSLLEDTFPLIWIEGELGNVARPSSGHLYLTLKDELAQVRAAMFKPKANLLNFQPREGLRVLARGRVTLYEARGEYQMVLDHMEEAGEGALRRAFEQLKARLQAEGLFAQERRRALPVFPRRIALITSPTGAVVRDVLSVLKRRFPLGELDVLPVPVQGATAAAQIRGMLSRAIASERYDVIVLARGGGSLEDLWAFNDEELARAIAASPVPVVSAVGHETDFSLSDFVADVRAPTPSVAAELLAPEHADLQRRLQRLEQRIAAKQRHRLQELQQRVDHLFAKLHARRPQQRLRELALRQNAVKQRLDAVLARKLQSRIADVRHAGARLRLHAPERRLALLSQRLAAMRHRPRNAMVRTLQQQATRLRASARSLETVSPLATVARGYSILQKTDGSVIRSVHDVSAGEPVRARLHDGQLSLQIVAIDPKGNGS